MHFRTGEKHSNHGNDARDAVARLVRLIRCRYDEKVPIIVTADSGFLSDENLLYFENELKIRNVTVRFPVRKKCNFQMNRCVSGKV